VPTVLAIRFTSSPGRFESLLQYISAQGRGDELGRLADCQAPMTYQEFFGGRKFSERRFRRRMEEYWIVTEPTVTARLSRNDTFDSCLTHFRRMPWSGKRYCGNKPARAIPKGYAAQTIEKQLDSSSVIQALPAKSCGEDSWFASQRVHHDA
jgi:hypothetical protein